LAGPEPIARLLSNFQTLAPGATVEAVWLNGAPGFVIDVDGEVTAVSVVVDGDRISRIFAVRNPAKLTRLADVATLSRAE